MQIFIKTLHGQTITLEVESYETIEDINNKLRDKNGLPPECFRLFFGGKVLDDEKKTLEEYKISKESAIFQILKIKGG